MRFLVGLAAGAALAACVLFLVLGTTTSVETGGDSGHLEGTVLIYQNDAGELVAFGDADCGNALTDGPYQADLGADDECAAAERPKVIAGWVLGVLGVAGVVVFLRWRPRAAPPEEESTEAM